MNIPTDALFFSNHDPSKLDVAFVKNYFYREGRINEGHAIWILEKTTAILWAEPNVLQVDAPITGPSAPSSLQPLR
jgi:serine/threonine-protein phosphatase 2B catalytic subunit